MTIQEFKQTEAYNKARRVVYLDVKGIDISKKPSFILDMLSVIGVSHGENGDVLVDVMYEE